MFLTCCRRESQTSYCCICQYMFLYIMSIFYISLKCISLINS